MTVFEFLSKPFENIFKDYFVPAYISILLSEVFYYVVSNDCTVNIHVASFMPYGIFSYITYTLHIHVWIFHMQWSNAVLHPVCFLKVMLKGCCCERVEQVKEVFLKSQCDDLFLLIPTQ